MEAVSQTVDSYLAHDAFQSSAFPRVHFSHSPCSKETAGDIFLDFPQEVADVVFTFIHILPGKGGSVCKDYETLGDGFSWWLTGNQMKSLDFQPFLLHQIATDKDKRVRGNIWPSFGSTWKMWGYFSLSKILSLLF